MYQFPRCLLVVVTAKGDAFLTWVYASMQVTGCWERLFPQCSIAIVLRD